MILQDDYIQGSDEMIVQDEYTQGSHGTIVQNEYTRRTQTRSPLRPNGPMSRAVGNQILTLLMTMVCRLLSSPA